MKTLNNYTQAENMRNIEINISYDIFLSQMYFHENFKVINENRLFYTNCEQYELPDQSELINFDLLTKANELEILQALRPDFSIREIAEEKTELDLDRCGYIYEIINEFDLFEIIDLLDGDFLNYEIINVTGCSQGDYAKVICKKSKDYTNNKKDLEQLIYNAPICSSIEIENTPIEFYYSDTYSFDKDKYIKELFDFMEFTKLEKDFFIANIPTELEYS